MDNELNVKVGLLELFIVAILITLIFGSISYMLLKHPEGAIQMSSFSDEFKKKPFFRMFLKFMGWWFLLLVIAAWIVAIISLFE
ncbi:hypothetical protein [Lysinibacillus xylanilyticus]|uniref:hypothetical protein n=1 Tax=Lysinibacillus xylanilyticus TaxID=582475 RepID=UPI003800C492